MTPPLCLQCGVPLRDGKCSVQPWHLAVAPKLNAIEDALSEIGRVVLRGTTPNSGFVFYADEVREVLLKLVNDIAPPPSPPRQDCGYKGNTGRICTHPKGHDSSLPHTDYDMPCDAPEPSPLSASKTQIVRDEERGQVCELRWLGDRESESEMWERELREAGWRPYSYRGHEHERKTMWVAPDGGLHLGPYGAWRMMKSGGKPLKKEGLL